MDRALQAQFERDPLLRRAAEWFFELRADSVSGERIAEWQQWLAQDQSHRAAFERIESFWRLSDRISAHWPTDAEVARDQYAGAQSVTAWRNREATLGAARRLVSPLGSLRSRVALLGAAAAAAIALLAIAYWPALSVTLQGGSRIAIRTDVGETRVITLPDGSVVWAGGQTSFVATLLKRSRTVRLERGEAFFHVIRDPARPFAVQAGDTTVTDIGTAFDVQRTRGSVVVAVAEGIVRVAVAIRHDRQAPSGRSSSSIESSSPATHRLEAGERLTVEASGASPELTPIDPTTVASWRDGRLQYLDEPLGSVVADLARYSSRRIVIDDPQLASLRVTGVVSEQNIDAWLSSLEATFPVRVRTRADGTVEIANR